MQPSAPHSIFNTLPSFPHFVPSSNLIVPNLPLTADINTQSRLQTQSALGDITSFGANLDRTGGTEFTAASHEECDRPAGIKKRFMVGTLALSCTSTPSADSQSSTPTKNATLKGSSYNNTTDSSSSPFQGRRAVSSLWSPDSTGVGEDTTQSRRVASDGMTAPSAALLTSLADALTLPAFEEMCFDNFQLKTFPPKVEVENLTLNEPSPTKSTLADDDLVSENGSEGKETLLPLRGAYKGSSSDDNSSSAYASAASLKRKMAEGLELSNNSKRGSFHHRFGQQLHRSHVHRHLRASYNSHNGATTSSTSWLYGFESTLTAFKVRHRNEGKSLTDTFGRASMDPFFHPSSKQSRPTLGLPPIRSPSRVLSPATEIEKVLSQLPENSSIPKQLGIRRKLVSGQETIFPAITRESSPAPLASCLSASLDSLLLGAENLSDKFDDCSASSPSIVREDVEPLYEPCFETAHKGGADLFCSSSSFESSYYRRPALSYKGDRYHATYFDPSTPSLECTNRRRSINGPTRRRYSGDNRVISWTDRKYRRLSVKAELEGRSGATEATQGGDVLPPPTEGPFTDSNSSQALMRRRRRGSSLVLGCTTVQSIVGARSSISVSHGGFMSGDLHCMVSTISPPPKTAAAQALLNALLK